MIFIGSSKGLLDLGGPIFAGFGSFLQLVFLIFSSKRGPKRGSRPISIHPMVGDNVNFRLDLDHIFDQDTRLSSTQLSSTFLQYHFLMEK